MPGQKYQPKENGLIIPTIIGNATLYLGDCADILPTLGKVDAVVTDPPYGINANKQTLGRGKKEFFRGENWDNKPPKLTGILEFGKYVCVWGGNYFADQLPITNDWLIWHKINDGRSFSECEMAWTNFGKQTRHLSHHWSGEEKMHPTMKPLAVMKWCISHLPDGCETILDPFMGSGTTGLAAVQMKLKFIGIEREQKYFDIACKRIEDAQRQESLF